MKNIIEVLKKNKMMLLGFGVLSLIAFASEFLKNKTEKSATIVQPPTKSLDTFIPKGFVLVPLEITNVQQLPSLISDAGIVDIFVHPENGHGAIKIASRIKLIQAPNNPEVYAALVTETDSSKILAHKGPFFASVQNPDSNNGNVITYSKAKSTSFEYQK